MRLAFWLLALYVFISILAFDKWREFSREKKLREYVSWHFTGYDGIPLWAEISNVSSKLELSAEYWIVDRDNEFVDVILDGFKKDLTECYFRGCLRLLKSKQEVRCRDYFLIALCGYLKEHRFDYNFLGYDMRKEMISRNPRDITTGSGSERTYILTDFAIVYHKLYYITYMFCKNSQITNPCGEDFHNDNYIKEILDTGRMTVSRY